jgi:general secretion pathway protein G
MDLRTQHQRSLRRKRQAGLSLIEILVVIAIIAMISSGIAVAVIVQKQWADIRLTTVNAEAMRHGIKTWWLENGTSTCPTPKELVADGVIDRNKKVEQDAWGQPWTIQCDARDATIISRGPDKLLGTEDDIRVPPS